MLRALTSKVYTESVLKSFVQNRTNAPKKAKVYETRCQRFILNSLQEYMIGWDTQ